jgi:hypothetical protein
MWLGASEDPHGQLPTEASDTRDRGIIKHVQPTELRSASPHSSTGSYVCRRLRARLAPMHRVAARALAHPSRQANVNTYLVLQKKDARLDWSGVGDPGAIELAARRYKSTQRSIAIERR